MTGVLNWIGQNFLPLTVIGVVGYIAYENRERIKEWYYSFKKKKEKSSSEENTIKSEDEQNGQEFK